MEYIKLFVIILSCTSTALIFENFMSFNFDKRVNGNYNFYFGFCIILNTLINLIGNTNLNYLWSIFYVTFVSLYLYKDKRNNTFIPLFFLFLTIIVEETLVCFFLEWFFIQYSIPLDNFYYIAVFGSNIVLLIFYKPIKLLLSKKVCPLNKNYIFEILLLIISFLVVLCMSLFMKIDLPSQLIIILIFICITIFVFDIYLVFILDRIQTAEKLQEEVKIIKLNNQINEKYYQSKLEQYNQQLKLFHDIKHHLLVLEKLYESNSREKAKQYSTELIKKVSYKSISINNKVMRILINDLIEKCDLNRIAFKYEIDSRIGYEYMSEMDLVTIYSNLFCNALDALQNCDEPHLTLKMRIYNNMVITTISNNYNGNINIRNNHIISTKKDHVGIGIKNICEVITKNGGVYDINYNDEIFTFEVILPLIKEQENGKYL